MQAKILNKIGGASESVEVADINLKHPSVVHLKIAPEAVRAFEQSGMDLKLILKTGEIVLIPDFFIQDAEGNRNDLMLQDDAGVPWWGQYTSPWSTFHFTEIEEDGVAALPWWPWLLGLLGAGGIAAAAGGGGGGDSPARGPEISQKIDGGKLPSLDSDDIIKELDLNEFFSGNALTYSATGLPPGLSLDLKTGIISGTLDPSASQGGKGSDGIYNVTITAKDSSGNTITQDFEWTVGNPSPVADDDTAVGNEDTPVTGNVLDNDNDPDGDDLTVTEFTVDIDGDGNPDGPFPAGTPVTIPGVGELLINPDGSYTFTPEPDWNGNVPPIEYTITDGEDGSDKAQLNITINPEQDPPVAKDDSAKTNEGVPVSGDLLTNDSDPDGDPLTVTEFTVDTDGDGNPDGPFPTGTPVTIPGVGELLIEPDGSYTFTPELGWNDKVPPIEYTITDGNGGSDKATLEITVNATPETVGLITGQSNEDAETGINVDVKGAFTDKDGDTLTYSATGLPNGLSIDPTTGVITGTIDKSASQDGTDGVHSVIITATDGGGASVNQTFTWTVTNPAPDAKNDTATTDEDKPVSGNVLGGSGKGPGDVADSDPDGDTLTITTFTVAGDPTVHTAGVGSVTIAGVGTIELGTDGSYTFTPKKDWNGTVPTITYTVSDDEGGTDTGLSLV